jgi:quercetin dioxygenase-like cupin family protein
MMKHIVAAALLAIAIPVGAIAQMNHGATQADNLKWFPGPPFLPPGLQVAVLSGDIEKEGPFVLRAKHPAGYKIPAHTHAKDEHLTVLSGSFHFGMGPKLDETKGEKVTAGGYVIMPGGMQHYLWFTEDAVLQVHGTGPVDFNFVNPADDPRNKK